MSNMNDKRGATPKVSAEQPNPGLANKVAERVDTETSMDQAVSNLHETRDCLLRISERLFGSRPDAILEIPGYPYDVQAKAEYINAFSDAIRKAAYEMLNSI